MAYDRYVPEFTDKDGQIYGVMDTEAREAVANLNSAIDDATDESYEDTSDISISWTNGGYYRISDGAFVENDAYYYSEISIANGEKYVHFIGTPVYYACGIIFMAGDTKVGDSVPSASSTTPIDGHFAIPSGATKIRISKWNQPCSLAYSSLTYTAKDTEARNEISDLQSEIGDLYGTFNESAMYATDNLSIFEKGQINVVTGENYTDSDNYRSKSYIDKSIGIIHIDNGYRLRILLYSGDTYVGVWKNGSITQTTQWITDSETQIWDLQKTYNIRIIFNKDQTTLTESDLVHIKIFKSLAKEAPDNYIGVRSLTGNIKNNLTYGEYEVQSITFGSENRYINCNNGVISDAGGSNAHVSDYIDCSNVKAIRLTASPYYSFACMAFYDGAKAFIISYPSSSSNVNYWMEEIVVPADAKYVVFGNNSAFSGKLSVKIEFMTTYATKLNRTWIGKKWACVGDSLTEINDRATMRYMDYIQIATGVKPYNMGVSGTGYANGHANSKAFIDRIVNVPTDSDVVTIFGSNNDMFGDNLPVGDPTDTGTATLCGFINGTIDALYTAFPQAKLGIITPCPWENIYPSATTTLGQKGIAYSQALVDICKRRGIPCLDLFHCSGMRPWEASYRALYYTGDEGGGVHPDANGHKILATHIKAFLDTLLL